MGRRKEDRNDGDGEELLVLMELEDKEAIAGQQEEEEET